MTTIEAHCSSCNDHHETYICNGCSKTFSFAHLSQHRREIHQKSCQLDDNYNSFQQLLNDQKNDFNENSLIQKINQWEQDSIEKVKQLADQCRQKLIKHMSIYTIETEKKLNDIFDQPIKTRQGNRFNETDLDQLEEKLNKLKEEFYELTDGSIEEKKSSSFINEIYVITPLDNVTNWKQNGTTIVKGYGQGNDLTQLSHPYSICIDDNQTIYIIDSLNHCIVKWESNAIDGRIVAGGNGQGEQWNELDRPVDVLIDKKNNSLIISDWGNRRVIEWSREDNTKAGQVLILDIDCYGLAMDKNGYIYVCDSEKHEVRKWKRGEAEGALVAGGKGKGNQLDQLNTPTCIFVGNDLSLYVSDSSNHRIMKWVKNAKEGIVVAGGNGQGYSLTRLSYPVGLVVDQLGQIYVADFGNNRVMCWWEGAKEGNIVVGGNGFGNQSNQLNGPMALSFDREGNLYVSDCNNHRIQKFEIKSKNDI